MNDKETIEKYEKEIFKIEKKLIELKPQLDEINALKLSKKKILKAIDDIKSKNMSFIELWNKWLYSSGGNNSSWIPDKSTYPNFRELIDDNGNCHRYETIYVRELYHWDNLEYFYKDDNDEIIDQYKEIEKLSYDDLITFLENIKVDDRKNNDKLILHIKAANEVMTNNLQQFKYDW